MSVSVRPAIAEDVPTILRFVCELAEYEREPDAVVATEEMLRAALFGERPAAGTHQSTTLMGPAAEALIAERDQGAIGFALFFHNFSTWKGRRGLYLEDLYVTPDARGGGAGKALLAALASLALDRGCARFEWSVLDWNTPAIDFYRAIGAVPLEEWTIQRVSGAALLKLAGRQ